jgi:RecA-family ATPase
MLWLPRVGLNNDLVAFDERGRLFKTPLLEQIANYAHNFAARLIVIDTAADVFAGNEVIRNQVRRFINELAALANLLHGAVILCAHPSLSGKASGHGYSGSTSWNATVRSRLLLGKDDASDDKDARALSLPKANYGASGATMRLRWKDGVFIREDEGGIFGSIAKNKAEAAFLSCLDKCVSRGRNVSEARNAQTMRHGHSLSCQRLTNARRRPSRGPWRHSSQGAKSRSDGLD